MTGRITQVMALGGVLRRLVLWTLAEPLVVLLGGEEYEPAAPVLQIQCFAAVTVFVIGLAAGALRAGAGALVRRGDSRRRGRCARRGADADPGHGARRRDRSRRRRRGPVRCVYVALQRGARALVLRRDEPGSRSPPRLRWRGPHPRPTRRDPRGPGRRRLRRGRPAAPAVPDEWLKRRARRALVRPQVRRPWCPAWDVSRLP